MSFVSSTVGSTRLCSESKSGRGTRKALAFTTRQVGASELLVEAVAVAVKLRASASGVQSSHSRTLARGRAMGGNRNCSRVRANRKQSTFGYTANYGSDPRELREKGFTNYASGTHRCGSPLEI